jgi:hypothetical protein
MSIAALQFMANLMQGMGVPYQFMRWETQPPEDYYTVGEYIESPSLTREESGRQDSTFILRLFTRKSWMFLEQAKAKIESAVPVTAILPDGTGIAVFYESGMVVPTGDMQLKSMQINMTIQEWKVK